MRFKPDGFTRIELMIVVAVLLTLYFWFVGGPNTASAKAAIEAHGYRDVTNVQRHFWGTWLWYGCSEDDYAFTANAVNSNKQHVTLTACSGYISKSFTIRMQ